MPQPGKSARLAAADTAEAVDAFMTSLKHPFKAGIESIRLILHLGAKVKKLPAGGVAIADPGKLLKWLGKDRALVVFKDKNDLKAKQAGFAKIIRQWVACV